VSKLRLGGWFGHLYFLASPDPSFVYIRGRHHREVPWRKETPEKVSVLLAMYTAEDTRWSAHWATVEAFPFSRKGLRIHGPQTTQDAITALTNTRPSESTYDISCSGDISERALNVYAMINPVNRVTAGSTTDGGHEGQEEEKLTTLPRTQDGTRQGPKATRPQGPKTTAPPRTQERTPRGPTTGMKLKGRDEDPRRTKPTTRGPKDQSTRPTPEDARNKPTARGPKDQSTRPTPQGPEEKAWSPAPSMHPKAAGPPDHMIPDYIESDWVSEWETIPPSKYTSRGTRKPLPSNCTRLLQTPSVLLVISAHVLVDDIGPVGWMGGIVTILDHLGLTLC
jgi:hypothetical protein